jgi:hypothetical protein
MTKMATMVTRKTTNITLRERVETPVGGMGPGETQRRLHP